jgi:hypothetical protein
MSGFLQDFDFLQIERAVVVAYLKQWIVLCRIVWVISNAQIFYATNTAYHNQPAFISHLMVT